MVAPGLLSAIDFWVYYLHGSIDCAQCPAFVARPAAPMATRLCPSRDDNVSAPRALHLWHDPKWQQPATVRSHCRGRERERGGLVSGKHMDYIVRYAWLRSTCHFLFGIEQAALAPAPHRDTCDTRDLFRRRPGVYRLSSSTVCALVPSLREQLPTLVRTNTNNNSNTNNNKKSNNKHDNENNKQSKKREQV